jgi:hypothetical protein
MLFKKGSSTTTTTFSGPHWSTQMATGIRFVVWVIFMPAGKNIIKVPTQKGGGNILE